MIGIRIACGSVEGEGGGDSKHILIWSAQLIWQVQGNTLIATEYYLKKY